MFTTAKPTPATASAYIKEIIDHLIALAEYPFSAFDSVSRLHHREINQSTINLRSPQLTITINYRGEEVFDCTIITSKFTTAIVGQQSVSCNMFLAGSFGTNASDGDWWRPGDYLSDPSKKVRAQFKTAVNRVAQRMIARLSRVDLM